MNIDLCVDSLSMPLPEDILKRKWAGDLKGAMAAIDIRLQEELPEMLRARLVCEKERIRRLEPGAGAAKAAGADPRHDQRGSGQVGIGRQGGFHLY